MRKAKKLLGWLMFIGPLFGVLYIHFGWSVVLGILIGVINGTIAFKLINGDI